MYTTGKILKNQCRVCEGAKILSSDGKNCVDRCSSPEYIGALQYGGGITQRVERKCMRCRGTLCKDCGHRGCRSCAPRFSLLLSSEEGSPSKHNDCYSRCPDGFHSEKILKKDYNQCKPCIKNCLLCERVHPKCLKCAENHYFDEELGECTDNCPKNEGKYIYYGSRGEMKCLKCSKTYHQDCKQCTRFRCEICADKLHRGVKTKQLVSPDGRKCVSEGQCPYNHSPVDLAKQPLLKYRCNECLVKNCKF